MLSTNQIYQKQLFRNQRILPLQEHCGKLRISEIKILLHKIQKCILSEYWEQVIRTFKSNQIKSNQIKYIYIFVYTYKKIPFKDT